MFGSCNKMSRISKLLISLNTFPSFTPQILSGVILEVLSEDLGECFTDEVQVAWTKLMALLYWHITGAYQEVGWVKLSSSAVWKPARITHLHAWCIALPLNVLKRSGKLLIKQKTGFIQTHTHSFFIYFSSSWSTCVFIQTKQLSLFISIPVLI